MDLGGSVTSVIQQRPKRTAVAQYEAWLTEIVPCAQRYPGHRGVNVIRPHGGSEVYTIVLHFDTVEHLEGWLESETRAQLAERVKPLLAMAERIEIKTGLEFWFTPPPGHPHAKPYKQFL
jgi:antibiotic biosynthesis monooxygenase (ABM) superfamily enzyme